MRHAQIIKIGGSLIRSGHWLKALDAALEGAMKNKVVPIFVMGGGELADVIRRLKVENNFSETAEHHMSLLAMQQHGIMAQALRPQLQNVKNVGQALAHIISYTPSVICDYAYVFNAKEVNPVPSITSDSLTLWFAQQLCEAANKQGIALCCEALILKSCVVPLVIQSDAQALCVQGIVDAAFPRFAGNLSRCAHASWSVVNAKAALCI